MSATLSAQPLDTSNQKTGRKVEPVDPTYEKAKKNVMYFAIVSIIMLFGGLTSAVIVSKGGNFWVSTKLPAAFWISSALILAGSLTAIMAQNAIAKNKFEATKLFTTVTLVLGIGFGIFQFQGYKQMVDGGYLLTSRILDDEGKFIPTGEYGKDFTVSWQGETLKYEDGIFYKKTGPLSEVEKLKLTWTRNTSSSFIYILTFLHLLHMIGGIIYLMVVTVFAYQYRFNSSNYLKIKLSNIYWHFLGILWIYLFVFLQYIH
jgi:cytochrome c oxidase subunit III